MNNKAKIATTCLVRLAVLIALEIILSRFLSISAWNIKIGFAFIPLVIAGIWYGPVGAGIVGAVADFVGAVAFPIGPYFPGFTLTAFLMGCVYGFFLKSKRTMPRIILSVVVEQVICSFIINSLWISILYGSPYLGVMYSRIFQTVILIVIQIICIKLLDATLIAAMQKSFGINDKIQSVN